MGKNENVSSSNENEFYILTGNDVSNVRTENGVNQNFRKQILLAQETKK